MRPDDGLVRFGGAGFSRSHEVGVSGVRLCEADGGGERTGVVGREGGVMNPLRTGEGDA